MSWRCRAAVLALLVASGPCAARQEAEVGGVIVRLPAPAGFTEVSHLAPSRELAETLTPPGNRLLGVYMSAEDLEAVEAGQSAGWARYMMVQTDRQSESIDLGGSDFEQVRAVIRSQQEVLLENVRREVNLFFQSLEAGSDPRSRMEVGNLLPLGVFADEERRLASESLTKYRIGDAPDDPGYLVAGATNVLHVGPRVVFAYVYATYESEEDRRWVREVSDTWSAEILAANPARGRGLGAGIDWRRLAGWALTGALVVVLAWVIALLWKRRRA